MTPAKKAKSPATSADRSLQPEPFALRSSIDAGVTGGVTLFGTGGRRISPQPANPERPKPRPRSEETVARNERRKKLRKVAISALVAALLVMVLSAGGFFSGTKAAGAGQAAVVTPQPTEHEDKGAPTNHKSMYVVRPHPRGLPRKGARGRRDRRWQR